jgi:phosphonate transport system substrate-binding protein
VLGLAWLAGLSAKGVETPAAGTAAESLRGQNPPELVRIGIAPGTWAGVNRSDATAAIRAWAKIIMEQRGASVEVETTLFDTSEAMSRALGDGRVDAVSMLTDQFLALPPAFQSETVFCTSQQDVFTERYVLLVHRASGIGTLNGLLGRKLVLQGNARTSLAPYWLDTLLARQSLGPAASHFTAVNRIASPSKSVLQVYFRQTDACLVTSNAFALASELNPQIGKELRVLAVSPAVVPSLFCFLHGHASRARELLEPAMLSLHESPAGQQVLTIFQAERMTRHPSASLQATRALLTEYDQLKRPPDPGEKKSALSRNEGER